MRISINSNDSFDIKDGSDTLASVQVPGALRAMSMATINSRSLEIRTQIIWNDHFNYLQEQELLF